MPFVATRIPLEIIILSVSKVGQKEKDMYMYIMYMWNLKCDTNEPYL